MNRRRLMISTLFITAFMMNLLIMPVRAGPPTGDATINYMQSGNTYYITITNTGGKRILQILFDIDDVTVTGWSYPEGWALNTNNQNQPFFSTSGKYVLGRGDSVTFGFTYSSVETFTCRWYTRDNKQNVLDWGTFTDTLV
jgi:hypothetical protein